MSSNQVRDRYELWLRDPEAWRRALRANAVHGYGFTVIVAAGLWMLSLQDAIADGKQLEDVAEETFREIDRGLGRYGLTGFQYGALISTIAEVWEHGDQLRRWHNLRTQLGDEGEKANAEGGVLNPALLSVGPKGDD